MDFGCEGWMRNINHTWNMRSLGLVAVLWEVLYRGPFIVQVSLNASSEPSVPVMRPVCEGLT